VDINKPDYQKRMEEIRNDLVRNPITEPLYSHIRDNPTDLFDIMIDVNMQFHEGSDNAFEAVKTIARDALRNKDIGDESGVPESVGSKSNPYMAGPHCVLQVATPKRPK
jgi:hypothetical protein